MTSQPRHPHSASPGAPARALNRVGKGAVARTPSSAARSSRSWASRPLGESRLNRSTSRRRCPTSCCCSTTPALWEKMIDGSAAKCEALGTASSPNRWGQAVQSLTGPASRRTTRRVSMPRTTGSAFEDEYTINGSAPYDVGYYLPYSRPAALTATNEACVVTPLGLPGVTAPQGVGSFRPRRSEAPCWTSMARSARASSVFPPVFRRARRPRRVSSRSSTTAPSTAQKISSASAS